MVQNLNVLSFAPYGNLLAERSDGAAMPKGAIGRSGFCLSPPRRPINIARKNRCTWIISPV